MGQRASCCFLTNGDPPLLGRLQPAFGWCCSAFAKIGGRTTRTESPFSSGKPHQIVLPKVPAATLGFRPEEERREQDE
jgi:hypothetical protein